MCMHLMCFFFAKQGILLKVAIGHYQYILKRKKQPQQLHNQAKSCIDNPKSAQPQCTLKHKQQKHDSISSQNSIAALHYIQSI